MRTTLTLFLAISLEISCRTAPQSVQTTDWNAADIIAGTRNLILERGIEDPYYGGKRHLLLQCWYPIEDFPLSAERADYLPFFEVVQKEANISEEEVEALSMIKTRSLAGVRIKKQKGGYPVLILSPALGSHTSSYTYLAEELVSAGYVVIGINHQYESEYVIDPVGRFISANLSFHDSLKEIPIPEQITADGYRAAKGPRQQVLAEDIAFALEELFELNLSNFNNQLDLARIGAWGHSIGGAAVTDAARNTGLIKAVANLDGTPSSDALANGIGLPYLYLEDLTDYRQHDGYRMQFDRRDAFCRKGGSIAYRVLFAGIDHSSFYDYSYQLTPNTAEGIAQKEYLNGFISYLDRFFALHLSGEWTNIKAQQSDSLEVFVYPNP
ncbi:MAG: hypothetical protein AB8H47_19610 [Bacteroidia bacterium]